MLIQVAQPGICFCQHLQRWLPLSALQIARGLHHNNTLTFERLWDIRLPRRDKQPRIKSCNNVLIIQHTKVVNKKMKCILTQEVKDLGYKGSIVEVERHIFRNMLFPTGKAVYASPENLEENEEYLKSEEAKKYKGIDFTAKSLMEKLSGLHLRIPMNGETKWVLDKKHIRVACRHMGLILKDSSITLPKEPVTQPGEIVFGVALDGRLKTKVRATVYLAADNEPLDRDIEFKELWDNPPVNRDNPIEFISVTQQTVNSVGEQTENTTNPDQL